MGNTRASRSVANTLCYRSILAWHHYEHVCKREEVNLRKQIEVLSNMTFSLALLVFSHNVLLINCNGLLALRKNKCYLSERRTIIVSKAT